MLSLILRVPSDCKKTCCINVCRKRFAYKITVHCRPFGGLNVFNRTFELMGFIIPEPQLTVIAESILLDQSGWNEIVWLHRIKARKAADRK